MCTGSYLLRTLPADINDVDKGAEDDDEDAVDDETRALEGPAEVEPRVELLEHGNAHGRAPSQLGSMLTHHVITSHTPKITSSDLSHKHRVHRFTTATTGKTNIKPHHSYLLHFMRPFPVFVYCQSLPPHPTYHSHRQSHLQPHPVPLSIPSSSESATCPDPA